MEGKICDGDHKAWMLGQRDTSYYKRERKLKMKRRK